MLRKQMSHPALASHMCDAGVGVEPGVEEPEGRVMMAAQIRANALYKHTADGKRSNDVRYTRPRRHGGGRQLPAFRVPPLPRSFARYRTGARRRLCRPKLKSRPFLLLPPISSQSPSPPARPEADEAQLPASAPLLPSPPQCPSPPAQRSKHTKETALRRDRSGREKKRIQDEKKTEERTRDGRRKTRRWARTTTDNSRRDAAFPDLGKDAGRRWTRHDMTTAAATSHEDKSSTLPRISAPLLNTPHRRRAEGGPQEATSRGGNSKATKRG
ncbi:hypothetical protein R3P38DRAFT_3608425 [Favolaschia claudopus]|uniref:Uncharacterized protein n=1 Tax=Favolaschia claudopus TaxID=2862362 RepID=A0AAW0DHD6_9AGAR